MPPPYTNPPALYAISPLRSRDDDPREPLPSPPQPVASGPASSPDATVMLVRAGALSMQPDRSVRPGDLFLVKKCDVARCSECGPDDLVLVRLGPGVFTVRRRREMDFLLGRRGLRLLTKGQTEYAEPVALGKIVAKLSG